MFLRLLSISLLGLILSQLASATIITSLPTGGNWNQGSTWVGGVVPSAPDTVLIAGGSIINITANAVAKRLSILNDTASTTVNLDAGISIIVTDALLLGSPTRDNRLILLNIGAGSAEFGTVIYSGSSTSDSRRSIVRISTGSLKVIGDFNMGSTASQTRRRLEITDAGSFELRGRLLNQSTLTTAPGSSVSFLGAGDYSIFGVTYHNLTINAAGKKTSSAATINGKAKFGGSTELLLTGNLTIKDSLVLTGAVISQNNSNLILSANFALAGNFGASNYFNQNGTGLLQMVGDSASRYIGTFPLGANGQYTPFTITRLAANFPANPGQRNLEIKTFGFRHPLLTGTNNAANRFWRIRTNNITVITKFAATFSYTDTDVSSPINEASLTSTARLRNNGWQVGISGSIVNQANNSFSVDSSNNVIDGDYTFGQASAFPLTVSFVYSIRNGEWGTAANWSTGTVPSGSSDVMILHAIEGAEGSCNNVTVSLPGVLRSSSQSWLVNGTITVNGTLSDSHSGGINTILGKVTVNPGGIFSGTGSGSGTSFFFNNDIENNGDFNINTNTIRFGRQVKSVLRLSGTRPINYTGSGNIRSLVDTLILDFSATSTTPAIFDPTFTVGDSLYNFNCVVLNKTAIQLNTLTARPTVGFDRKFIQGSNAYLGIRNGTPFSGTNGILDASANGNTVGYNQANSQVIAPQVYFNMILNGDRNDRFKTIASGGDMIILGNLTANNNSAVLQFSSNSSNQNLTINGDYILNGNAYFRTTSGNNVRNFVTIGGKIINNSNQPYGINAKTNDTTFTSFTFNGSGTVAEGSGNFRFRNLTLAGADSTYWNGTGVNEVNDTLTNNTLAFNQRRGQFYIPTDAVVTIKGSSANTKFRHFVMTDRNDRFAGVFQKINLEVDSLINFLANGRASTGAFYNFSGSKLKINGELRLPTNDGNSVLRADSLSTFEIVGNSTTSGLTFATGFRKLGTLIHNKSTNPLAIGQLLTVYNRLDLLNGIMTGATNLRMNTGSTVRRSNGGINAAFSNTSGKYNLEYWTALISGPEASSGPALNKLTIRAAIGDTITFGNSPTLDSNLVYVSGKMKAGGINYVRLGTNSFVEISASAPQVVFPIGSLTAPSFIGVDVMSLASGKLFLKPYRSLAANIPADANVRLNRYVEASGNASGLLYSLGLFYVDADVIGGPESALAANFWNGTDWNSTGGVVEPIQNVIGKVGIIGNGVLTAFGINVSVKNVLNGDIQVFPNPTKDKITIRTTENFEVVSLKDILGKEVKLSWSITSQGIQLDMSRLVDGIYFLHLKGDNRNEILRLVKH